MDSHNVLTITKSIIYYVYPHADGKQTTSKDTFDPNSEPMRQFRMDGHPHIGLPDKQRVFFVTKLVLFHVALATFLAEHTKCLVLPDIASVPCTAISRMPTWRGHGGAKDFTLGCLAAPGLTAKVASN